MNTFEVTGTYGSQKTETTIYCAADRRGGTWYTPWGSTNVNYTYDPIEEGVNIEELRDADYFSWKRPINSTEDLIEAIEA